MQIVMGENGVVRVANSADYIKDGLNEIMMNVFELKIFEQYKLKGIAQVKITVDELQLEMPVMTDEDMAEQIEKIGFDSFEEALVLAGLTKEEFDMLFNKFKTQLNKEEKEENK